MYKVKRTKKNNRKKVVCFQRHKEHIGCPYFGESVEVGLRKDMKLLSVADLYPYRTISVLLDTLYLYLFKFSCKKWAIILVLSL